MTTIREIRTDKLEWTQKKMAEFLGITRQAYWKKESGRSKLKSEELLRICKEAGVNPLDVELKV